MRVEMPSETAKMMSHPRVRDRAAPSFVRVFRRMDKLKRPGEEKGGKKKVSGTVLRREG